MTDEEIQFVKDCIKDDDIHRFYNWGRWKQIRKQVLDADKEECQRCKAKGIYTHATTVHHINFVKRHPELALEPFCEWRGKQQRNLISLCHDCHEAVHGYRKPEGEEPLTAERWD